MASYYIDGATFESATSIFLDAALITCAPNGFYSDGITTREQIGCFLQPPDTCAACDEPCGVITNLTGGPAFYRADINVYNAGATGAIIIRLNPQHTPVGISALYNGNTYNKLSSPFDGLHASTDPLSMTFIGASVDDCGISGVTYPSLSEFAYDPVTNAYVSTLNVVSLTVAAGHVSLSLGPPSSSIMVIPKTSPLPSTLSIYTAIPCVDAITSVLEIECPVELTGFSSSGRFVFPPAPPCAGAQSQTYYNAPVTGTPGVPALYDWVFSDPNGEFILADGYYVTPVSSIEVQDGIVIAFTTCP
jgi:hypothetical protein